MQQKTTRHDQWKNTRFLRKMHYKKFREKKRDSTNTPNIRRSNKKSYARKNRSSNQPIFTLTSTTGHGGNPTYWKSKLQTHSKTLGPKSASHNTAIKTKLARGQLRRPRVSFSFKPLMSTRHRYRTLLGEAHTFLLKTIFRFRQR